MSPAVRNIFVNAELQSMRAGWKIGMLFGLMALANLGVTMPVMSVLKSIPGLPVELTGTFIAYGLLTVITWLMLKYVDRRPFHSVGITFKGKWGKELMQGLLFGTGMMTFIVLVEYSSGMYMVEFRGLALDQAFIIGLNGLALYVVVGYGEELLFRGYLFQAFVEGTNKVVATLSISLLFAAAHAGNPNVSMFGLINVALAGIWLSVAYFKTKALWLPIGLHISWNFVQGFVFSLPVSGTTSENTQIGKAIVNGPEWLTGGTFGPEGGALATVMLVIGTGLIYWWNWVGASDNAWSYEHWREERKQQLLTAISLPVQEQP